jgi:hypothetical protein
MIPPDCVPVAGEVVFEILRGPLPAGLRGAPRPSVYEFFLYWPVAHVDGLPDGDGPFTKAQIFLDDLEAHKAKLLARGLAVRTVDRRVPPVPIL